MLQPKDASFIQWKQQKGHSTHCPPLSTVCISVYSHTAPVISFLFAIEMHKSNKQRFRSAETEVVCASVWATDE